MTDDKWLDRPVMPWCVGHAVNLQLLICSHIIMLGTVPCVVVLCLRSVRILSNDVFLDFLAGRSVLSCFPNQKSAPNELACATAGHFVAAILSVANPPLAKFPCVVSIFDRHAVRCALIQFESPRVLDMQEVQKFRNRDDVMEPWWINPSRRC